MGFYCFAFFILLWRFFCLCVCVLLLFFVCLFVFLILGKTTPLHQTANSETVFSGPPTWIQSECWEGKFNYILHHLPSKNCASITKKKKVIASRSLSSAEMRLSVFRQNGCDFLFYGSAKLQIFISILYFKVNISKCSTQQKSSLINTAATCHSITSFWKKEKLFPKTYCPVTLAKMQWYLLIHCYWNKSVDRQTLFAPLSSLFVYNWFVITESEIRAC